MTTKLVCRLLDAEHRLLGWTEVQAVARGDGRLWSQGPVSIVAERQGLCSVLSIHWCDVNVETRIPFPSVVPVSIGQVLVVFPSALPMIVVGEMPGPLPAVTVRGPVGVSVPVGQMGAVGLR